jgi:hypothetical protein
MAIKPANQSSKPPVQGPRAEVAVAMLERVGS